MTELARLRTYLGSLTSEQLENHLSVRPDVLIGQPVRDLDDLAERLVRPASVVAALETLTWPHLEVLETLEACGAGASAKRAVELLDPAHAGRDSAAHAAAVGRIIDRLHALLLVWPAGDQLDVNSAVLTVLPSPLTMGRTAAAMVAQRTPAEHGAILTSWGVKPPSGKANVAEAVVAGLGDPVLVRRVVATAPAGVAEYLTNRALRVAQVARARVPDPLPSDRLVNDMARAPAESRIAATAATWAREHGLGMSWSSYYVGTEFPCEVLLALLPAGAVFPFAALQPTLPTAPITTAQVTSSASGALTTYLAAAMATLESLARTPLATLKGGGIGVRELNGVVKRLRVDAVDVRLTLEVAAALGLIGQDRSGKVRSTGEFDGWRTLPPPERAADLVLAWLSLDWTPTLDRDDDDHTIPALTAADDDFATARRIATLMALDPGEAQVGVVSPKELARVLAWRSPLTLQELSDEDVAATWAEAERLGVAAHGALSAIGRAALNEDPQALIDALAAALPPVQRTAIFGSDLTVIVPGSPDASVVDLLDATATREARGAASTWRITAASVRAALDEGYEADDVLARLRNLADGPLPQPLEYLVRDVGRRYGAVAVGPSDAVLVGEEALLSEMEVHKALRQCGLRRVAPTVLVASAAPAVVVDALRGAGYLPRHVDGEGSPVIRVGAAPPRPMRAAAADSGAGSGPTASAKVVAVLAAMVRQLDGDEVVPFADDVDDRDEPSWSEGHSPEALESPAAAAQRLRATAPAPASPLSLLELEIGATAKQLTPAQARLLAGAISTGKPVMIGYSSSRGRSVTVLSGLKLTSGYLSGAGGRGGDRPVFALATVDEVGPALPGSSAGMSR